MRLSQTMLLSRVLQDGVHRTQEVVFPKSFRPSPDVLWMPFHLLRPLHRFGQSFRVPIAEEPSGFSILDRLQRATSRPSDHRFPTGLRFNGGDPKIFLARE